MHIFQNNSSLKKDLAKRQNNFYGFQNIKNLFSSKENSFFQNIMNFEYKFLFSW